VASRGYSQAIIGIFITPGLEDDKKLFHVSIRASDYQQTPDNRRPPPFMIETLNRYLETLTSQERISVRTGEADMVISFQEVSSTEMI
jgi:hypothetical protein